MATNNKVFEQWIERKLKVHPDRTEFKVPHSIVRHMVHCKCPKPQQALLVHGGWNANSGPKFREYDRREFKIEGHWEATWFCTNCLVCVYNPNYKG